MDEGSCRFGVGRWTMGARLRELGLYSVRGRLLRADLIKMWKVFHTGSGTGVLSLFRLSTNERTRGHSFKLEVPRCNSEVFRRSLPVRRVTVWNGLPADVVESESLSGFKSGLGGALGELFLEVL